MGNDADSFFSKTGVVKKRVFDEPGIQERASAAAFFRRVRE